LLNYSNRQDQNVLKEDEIETRTKNVMKEIDGELRQREGNSLRPDKMYDPEETVTEG